MVDQKIKMDVDETLELDYLVEEVSRDAVTIYKEPSGLSESYYSTDTYVFDPSGTGTFQLDINGQTIEIEVTDIPDSVVVQHYANTWSQGDSIWNDDVGSASVSLTGDFQDDTLSDGSESILGDGTDNYGAMTAPPELEGSSLQQFSYEIVLEASHTSSREYLGIQNNDTDQLLLLAINIDETNSADAGNLNFYFQDDSGSRIRCAPSTNPGINDGNRHDISWIVNDSTTADVELIIDGTSYSLNFDSSATLDNFTTWDGDILYWARRNDDQSVDGYWPGEIAADRWHDTNIPSQTINDYP